MKKKNYTGIVLWSGKSEFDGERIMFIATGVFNKSKNSKTGDVIQTWILRRDIDPILARRLGEDKSICFRCKLRESGVCYVNLRAPLNIYRAYHDGSYKTFEESDLKYFKGKVMRLGSYGDPLSLPFEVVDNIGSVCKRVLSYSHSWRTGDQRYKKYCMASVDSIKGYMKEYEEAQRMGWRTFRVRESLDNELKENEFICPASKEGKKDQGMSCSKCLSCCGTIKNLKKNPVIELHGDTKEMGSWRHKRYLKMMMKIKNKQKWRKDRKKMIKDFHEVCSC